MIESRELRVQRLYDPVELARALGMDVPEGAEVRIQQASKKLAIIVEVRSTREED